MLSLKGKALVSTQQGARTLAFSFAYKNFAKLSILLFRTKTSKGKNVIGNMNNNPESSNRFQALEGLNEAIDGKIGETPLNQLLTLCSRGKIAYDFMVACKSNV